MGIDTTPASNDGDSEGRDSAPRWVLVVVVILVVVAAWWVLSAVFGTGSSA